MRAISKIGVVQAPAKHEAQSIGGTNISRQLFKVIGGLVGVLIGQRREPAQPPVGWHGS